MVSRLIKGAAVLAGAISLAGTASAGCGGMYCNSGSTVSTLPALSSWTADSGAGYSLGSYSSSASYAMSSAQADAQYGVGSVSDSYTMGGGNVQYFSGSTSSVAGLGYNESLQMTNCPTNVYGTEAGSRVLGCYNVVQQVPQTNYVRVVRPVIYVRYPVPVPVPYSCGTVVTHTSRYGGYGPQGGFYGHGYKGGCR